MHSLAHYALLGSLLAAAAGALVLTTLTIQHGFKRRSRVDDDTEPRDAQRRLQTIQVADAVAVACFAVAAGLGILGLMQTTSLTPRAIAAVDDGKVGERLHALETRLAGAELQIQGRTASPELRAWEERLARLETRPGAVEDRAAVAERRSAAAEKLARERRDERARPAPVAVPRRAPPVLLAPRPAAAPPPPSASPRFAPQAEHQAELSSPKVEATAPPPAVGVAPVPWPPPAVGVAPPSPAVGVAPPPPPSPATVAVVPPPPAPTPPTPREAVRPRVEPEPSLGDKVRKDWDVIRRHVERGGDEWKDGWRQLKGLFGY